jgi:hypothetical protein
VTDQSFTRKTIYDFIEEQESGMQKPIHVNGWDWNLKEHVKTSFFYKYGRLLTGNQDDKPVKNIVRPILNLAYRAEDIDVKDIVLYIDDPAQYHLSFLIKKYHDDVFVLEHDLDTFIDELKESKIDYGGGLSKYLNSPRPEVVPLQSIAFCDQTDLLSGPIGIKHYYSPDQLKEKEKHGWGDKKYGATASINDVILLAQTSKEQEKTEPDSQTPGKYIEVYEVHGALPEEWLGERTDYENTIYVRQMQIICFYTNKDRKKTWVTLFRAREKESPFKFVNRDPVFGRALGFGGAEELFENQVWTNFSMIQKRQMLEMAAKTILKTTDAAFANRNNIRDMDNGQIAILEDGKDIAQLDTQPRSMVLFDRWDEELEVHARNTGAAQEAISGDEPPAGTPFKSVEFQARESHSLHEYRRGKYAKHLEEIYRDWIIPHIAKKVSEDLTFLSELSLDELHSVMDGFVNCILYKGYTDAKGKHVEGILTERVLRGENIEPGEQEAMKEQVKQDFLKSNKKFLQILKGEMKEAAIKVKINVAGKQKNLSLYTDKLVNILRQIVQAPQILDDPRLAKIFNEILEASGLSPVDFYNRPQLPQGQIQQIQQPQQQQPAPAL